MHGAVQKLKGYSTDDLLLRTKAAGLDYAADWMSTGLPGKKLQVQTFVRPTLQVYWKYVSCKPFNTLCKSVESLKFSRDGWS